MRMVTVKMTVNEYFCSFTKSNRLYKIWLAGVNWKEFQLTTKLEDISVISIPLICQDIMKVMAQQRITENVIAKKKDNKKKIISLLELSQLTIGVVKVFEHQIMFLYEQVLQRFVQQSNWDLDFNQQSEKSSLSVEDNLNTLSTKKTTKRKGNASSAKPPPRKRAKQVKNIRFQWSLDITSEEVQDVETDNEITMKMLQTSIVMNKTEITMRDLEDFDDEPASFSQMSQFEAIDHPSMQLFHEIRELVLSSDPYKTNTFSKKSKKSNQIESLVNAEVEEYEKDNDEYETGGFNLPYPDQQDDNSLPDISMYQPVEEHVEPMTENDDEYETDTFNQQQNHSTATNHKLAHSLPDISTYQPELNEKILCEDNAETDCEMQFEAPISNVLQLNERQSSGLQTLNGHLIDDHRIDDHRIDDHRIDDSVQNISRMVVKIKSRKRKRQFKDTVLQVDFNAKYQTNTSRCSNSRLDVVSKADLLHNYDSKLFIEPTHMFKGNLKFCHFKDVSFSNKLLIAAKRFLLQPTEETDIDMVNDFLGYRSELPKEAVIRPKAVSQRNNSVNEGEIQPTQDKDDSSTNVFQNDSPMWDCDDVPVQIEDPCVEFSTFTEPAPVEPVLNESEVLDIVPLIEPPNQFHVELPPQILKVLNIGDSGRVSDANWSTNSEEMFILKHQKNREEWGVKGVMQHLFWLWNNNIYPISMKELTQSSKLKTAAALAFMSILQLNSPRVGLIVIEKQPNSNEIYNIAKSEKLNDLLQDIY